MYTLKSNKQSDKTPSTHIIKDRSIRKTIKCYIDNTGHFTSTHQPIITPSSSQIENILHKGFFYGFKQMNLLNLQPMNSNLYKEPCNVTKVEL